MRWTILRPHFFMQNLLGAAHGIAADRAFSLNMGEGRLGMIDVRDVAELAAQVLTEEPDRHHGKIYTPTGPQSISFAEGAEQLRQILGREVRYVPVADEAARTNLLETGMPEWIVELQVEYGQALRPAGATSRQAIFRTSWVAGRGALPTSLATTPACSRRQRRSTARQSGEVRGSLPARSRSGARRCRIKSTPWSRTSRLRRSEQRRRARRRPPSCRVEAGSRRGRRAPS